MKTYTDDLLVLSACKLKTNKQNKTKVNLGKVLSTLQMDVYILYDVLCRTIEKKREPVT